MSLLKNNDENVREAEIQKDLVSQKLVDQRFDFQKLKDSFIECNLIVSNIIKNIRDTDSVLKDMCKLNNTSRKHNGEGSNE